VQAGNAAIEGATIALLSHASGKSWKKSFAAWSTAASKPIPIFSITSWKGASSAVMIELTDTVPDLNVQPAEYARLLGYPRGWVMEGRPLELAEWARAWYTRHGRCVGLARQVTAFELTQHGVCIDCAVFTSARLAKTLGDAGAHTVVLVAVSAGPK